MTRREIMDCANAAIKKVDQRGVRGVEMVTYQEVEALVWAYILTRADLAETLAASLKHRNQVRPRRHAHDGSR